MKRLRLIKERTRNVHIENDLRGLGFDPVLQKTHIEPYLAIHNLKSEVDSLIQHFSLKKEESEHKNTFYIISPISHLKPHKEQAVTLFGVGLYISKNHPLVRLYLGQLSYFHYHMALALGRKKEAKAFLPDNVIKAWLRINERFVLEMPIQHYIRQAGFNIIPKDGTYNLTEEEIIDHYSYLILEEEAQRKEAHNE